MGIKISKDHLHPSVIESITSLIGDLSQLETTAKGNAVEAINEILANGGNKEELEALIAEIAEGKELIASILQEEGVSVTEEDNMVSLITKVDQEFNDIKQQLVDILVSKGIECSNSDSFDDLIEDIANINVIENNSTILLAREAPGIQSDMTLLYEYNYKYTMNANFFFDATYVLSGTSFTDEEGYPGYLYAKIGLYIEQYRDGELIDTISHNQGSSGTANNTHSKILQLENVQCNDTLKFYVNCREGNVVSGVGGPVRAVLSNYFIYYYLL